MARAVQHRKKSTGAPDIMRNLLAVLLTLSAGPVLAQEDTTNSEAEADPSVDERLTATEEQLTSLAEQLLELKSALSPLTRLRFSGFIQGRYEWGAARADAPEEVSHFIVRRARLQATYSGELAEAVLQLDAVPTGVTLLDAEATLFIPGTQQTMAVTIGQMRYPFGYEPLQSTADLELPERSRVVRTFLPGVRDRGVRYSGSFGIFRLRAGIFDGNGTRFPGYVGRDNDKEKDIIGRFGFDLKLLSGGISAWYGHTLGQGPTDDFRRAYQRTRIGADLQVYLDVLPLGTTALKGEYIWGTTYVSGDRERLGQPASGWYVLLVQNLGLSNAVAVRYDYFDPAHGTPALANGPLPADTHPIGTLGVSAIHLFGEHLKLMAAYELVTTQTVAGVEDPPDDRFTLQLQARF